MKDKLTIKHPILYFLMTLLGCLLIVFGLAMAYIYNSYSGYVIVLGFLVFVFGVLGGRKAHDVLKLHKIHNQKNK